MNPEPESLDGSLANIAKSAQAILTKYTLCNSCLGRQYALLGREIANIKRGESLKLYLALVGSEFLELDKKEAGIELLKIVASHGNFQSAIASLKKLGITIESAKSCYICEGFMEKLDEFAELILKTIAEREYHSFLIGSKIPEIVIDREDGLRAEFNLKYGESIKAELNRELGKRLLFTGKTVDFDAPDLVALINPTTREILINVNPLFIYGRYRKLKRGISQTRWICWNCEGRGCDECKGTGLRYEYSVEVFVADPILKTTGGTDYRFHGGGREDIDARMLGSGRPFVVEIKEPKTRMIDLAALQQQINELAKDNIEVENLEWSDRDTIRNIKALAQIKEKTYRVLVETRDPISPELIQKADETLSGVLLQQRTPQRVLHRRADKLRVKKIYEFKTAQLEIQKFEIIVKCQGGCYVKELITGDEGRTQPNFSELLNTQATVLELDVLHVAE